MKASWVAQRLGLKHRQQITKIEQKKDVSVSEFVAYVTALDLRPGDLLENSAGLITPEIRSILDRVKQIPAQLLPRVEAIVANIGMVVHDYDMIVADETSSRGIVVPFKQNVRESRSELSEDAMEKLAKVMKLAGAEPRKAARGPEREVRFYGLASAGEGIEFFDDIPAEYRQIPQWAWKKGARGVFKAAGDSMHDVGIWDQDIMFVKPTPFPQSGEIVICTLNKKVFVKRLKLNERGQPVQLESKNEAYKPIPITPDDEVEFFGVVVGRTGDM